MSVTVSGALSVRAVIDLAHGFGLRTVAEGVEDQATLAGLEVMGCDAAQGFHIARPMPADDPDSVVQKEKPDGQRPRRQGHSRTLSCRHDVSPGDELPMPTATQVSDVQGRCDLHKRLLAAVGRPAARVAPS